MSKFKAVLFDFNGVVIDDEPLHFRLFQEVCRENDISVSKRDYYTHYLGFDDKGSFEAIYRDAGKALAPETLHALIEEKSRRYDRLIVDGVRIFPGVVELVKRLSPDYLLAIVSGALRREIVAVTRMLGIESDFLEIVSANDTQFSKPHPEGYEKGFEALSLRANAPLLKHECLVIEDSMAGIQAAKGAGLRVLAVTNSYTREELHQADFIVDSLEGLDLNAL